MIYQRWYRIIIIRIALALFDHVNLKIVGYEKEEDRIQAVIRDN